MLKYLTKIAMDIFPSVVATIIGAYIVNHYINAKPAEPHVAAAVARADSKKADAGKADDKSSADVASLPAPGVTARGISEKPSVERAETKPVESKSVETKPAETASAPSEPRRHVPTLREKVMARISPTPAQAPAPVVAAPSVAPPVETAAPAGPEERKDATDLARAAIERLRNSQEGTSRAQDPRTQETAREAARAPESPRAVEPARATTVQPALRPLPPPISVSSTRALETYGAATASPPYTGAIRAEDPNRPIPPAEIPAAQPPPPIDLRADATSATRERPTVADDMLSAAKSMFNAVLPKSATD